jgi:SAM-dependent methyltransferase
LADASADFILCTETLEHVLDARSFLAEAARCLVPGGRILLTVPFSARWHYIPFDYWRFTPSSLAHLLAEAGFGNIQVYARGNEVTVACYKVMALILPLLAPQRGNVLLRVLLLFFGVLLLPAFAILGGIGNISLHGKGGDDCLGYTLKAQWAERA